MKNDSPIDCWSPSERKIKGAIEAIRAVLFYPIIAPLAKIGVTANMISYASAIAGIVATMLLWYNQLYAGILIGVSLLLDGIDGSLARATKQNNTFGSLTDAFTDQITISATGIGFIAVGLLHPVIGGLYLTTYPIVIIFSILRNYLKKPAAYVFRPRIFVFLIFWAHILLTINLLDYAVLLFSLILLYQAARDFYFLRGELCAKV